MMKATFFAVLCVASCAHALTVVPEGGAIVSGHKNYDAAAKELQSHLKLIAGVELPVVTEKDAPAGAFVWRIGEVPPGEECAAFKPEEARWKLTEKGAWFYGDTNVSKSAMAKTGVEMGVYAFLEDELGCRWPWPGGISVREQNPIVVEHASGAWVPPFRLRAIRSRDNYIDWRARMRDGRHDVPSYGHAFHAYWKRFASTHPEFFGMRRDGKRFPPDAPDNMTNPAVYAGKMGAAIAMCVSCDGLVDQLVEDWKAAGTNEYINLCENDATGDNRCHCPKCEALDEPPPPGSTNLWQNWFADRYVDFSNRVLAKARKIRPDAKACFYAYNMTEIAPRRVKTLPGVSVGVVPTVFTPERIRRYLRDWKAAGFSEFFYRPNRHHYYKSYNMPLGNEGYFFDIFKVVVAENPIGFDYDSGPQLDVLNFFRDYVIYKGMQDPSKDFAHWENHYCEAFGVAQEDVRAYFRFWREIWKTRIESHVEEYTKIGFDFGRPFLTRLGTFYSLDDYDKAEALLNRGLARPGLKAGHRALVKEMKDAFVHARLFYAATTKRCDENAKALYSYRVAHGIVPVLWHESYYNDLCGVYDYMKRNCPAEEVAKLPPYVRNHEERRKKREAAARARQAAATRARGKRLVVGVSEVCRTPEDVQVQRFYVDTLALAGHVPVVVPNVAGPGVYDDIVKKLDVLLLTGGEDVEPARYGAAKSPACGRVNKPRDAFEFALLDAAKARRLPIFGICRGIQMLNVYFGGTLWQDLPSEFSTADGVKKLHFKGAFPWPYAGAATNPPAHAVSAVAGSRLAGIIGTEPLLVNSHHHQAVQKVAPGFRISAYAPDGVTEAIESDSYPAAGVQFHPESILAISKTPGFDRERLMKIFTHLGELVGK